MLGETAGFEEDEIKPTGTEVHEYVFPATGNEPIEVTSPIQIDFADPAIARGTGYTVIRTESEFEQFVKVIDSFK